MCEEGKSHAEIVAPFPSERYRRWRRVLGRLCGRLRWEIDGIENMPPAGPAIVAMNHTGWEEILLSILAFDRPMCPVGMREILAIDDRAAQERIFASTYGRGWGTTRRRMFRALGTATGPVVRTVLLAGGFVPVGVFIPGYPPALGHNGIALALARLREGHPLLIFPQGGYRRNGEWLPFKPGIGLLAHAAARAGLHVPVVPVAQRTAGAISPMLGNRYVPRITVGAPIVWEDTPDAPVRDAIARFAADLECRVADLLTGKK